MAKSEVEQFFRSHAFIKSLTAGLISAGLDNYVNDGGVLYPSVITKNLAFGTLVGGSIIASNYIAPSLTHLVPIPDTSLYSGKTLEHRLIEVGLSTGSAIIVNKVVFDITNVGIMKQIGIIVLADVLSEYIADYSKSTKLSYLM